MTTTAPHGQASSVPKDPPPPERPGWTQSLSARLLVLTLVFVMVLELLVLVPSLANYWRNFLNQRLEAAHLAILARDATPDGMVTEDMEKQLLRVAGLRAVALKQEDYRELVLSDRQTLAIDARYDLRGAMLIDRIVYSLESLWRGGRGQIQVTGKVQPMPGEFIEIVTDEMSLYAGMRAFIGNILLSSLVLSVITAGLIYLALHWLIIKPMRQVTQRIIGFRGNPNDPARVMTAWRRHDEIGIAQREIARMQAEVRRALAEQARLASLGAAVGRINHDLRNILSGLQLASDSLSRLNDPRVKTVAARLMRAVDRGIRLCEDTLAYGKASEPPPVLRAFKLRPLVEEVGLLLGLAPGEELDFQNQVPAALEVAADADQLFRVILNLIRNAMEAMRGAGRLTVSAEANADRILLKVADSGPGIPAKRLDTLFLPFGHSSKQGGSGLGLAIAAELMRGHGQALWLADNSDRGAVFALSLKRPAPGQPA